MKLSVSTWNYIRAKWEKADLEEAIREILSKGFGLELWLGWAPWEKYFTRDNWDYLKELLASAPAISSHTSLREWNLEKLKQEIDMVHYLQGNIIVIHPSTIGIKEKVHSSDLRQAKVAVDYAKRNNITLALENAGGKNKNRWVENLKIVMDKIGAFKPGGGLGICIDVGHANLCHQEFDDPVIRFIDEFHDDIVHLHISDNHGEKDEHLVPGQGSIDWSILSKKISDLDFQGQAVLELKSSNAAQAAGAAKEFLL